MPILRDRLASVGETPATPLVVDLFAVRFIASTVLALIGGVLHPCNDAPSNWPSWPSAASCPRHPSHRAPPSFSVHSTVGEAIGSNGADP